MTDEQFVEAVASRRAAMYHVAMTYLRQSADAEDAVAEAIAATWAHLDGIRAEEALPAYLMQAAIHACHRQLRRRKREVAADDEALSTIPAVSGAPVWEYVCGLPEKYRVPVAMRYGDNIPESEIALALGLRRGTVSSRLARGLQLIRAQMKEEDNRNE